MKKETGVSLDVLMTGQVLSGKIKKSGYTIAEIQRKLKLACPQPVYRWINGQTLPSIDNLYNLSKLLKVPMDELVVARQDEVWVQQVGCNRNENIRLKTYHSRILSMRMR